MSFTHDPWFYVRPLAAGSRWQDAYPNHPDLSKLAREERRRADDLADWDGESIETPELLEAESLYRKHTHTGCGHECDSLACYTIAGLKDSQCLRCQLGEPDSHGPSRGMNVKA